MNRRYAFLSLLAIAATSACAQTSLQQSHTDGNVPPQESFAEFLNRDLLAFFQAGAASSATSVQFHLLRNGPTQSGVSFPKFFVWVKVFSSATVLEEGAASVAAINRTHFEITNFQSAQQINARPSVVSSIFPSVLVPIILERAGTK